MLEKRLLGCEHFFFGQYSRVSQHFIGVSAASYDALANLRFPSVDTVANGSTTNDASGTTNCCSQTQ